MKIRWKKLEQDWRRQLLSYAKGNVLEVGVGMGNNFSYYPIGVSVTATDLSARVIQVAKKEAMTKGVRTNFVVSPVEDLEFPLHSFDTIVSTFSLCAYEDPVEVLGQFNNWCKPNGMILLLEYGLSRCRVIRWMQRKWEPYYYRRTGCHIDRDMLSVIYGSPLRLKRMEIKYAGTVYLMWATLRPE
jgi:ubiquinone/menaquinone biosynthesis C-methylase UbiE